jgi:hypothetical protein
MQDAYLRIISANAVCRDGRIGVIRDHIVYDKNRDEICACENDHQAEKVAAAFNALAYIATLKTDQLASSAQCSAVAVAMDVLSLPNACRLAHADEKLTDQKETP